MNEESAPKSKGLPPAVVSNAVELVSYQDGAIVSRIIAKEPKGNITVFAFDEGQALSEHTVPYNALVHVLEGEVSVSISGKAHSVRGGEVIQLPANEPHALEATTRFKMILTMIRF
jgi:quercetin dioxygenase-like cupin family protein